MRTEGITFLAADVELAGDDAKYSHPLKDFLSQSKMDARAFIKPNEDSPWTLGRILYLFGEHLLSDIKEFGSGLIHNLFMQSFMAILHDEENLSIPFVCADYFCECHLMFSPDKTLSADTKDTIAKSFWSLLLSDPNDIEDYECVLHHSKIGSGDIRYGVEQGVPFVVDIGE